MAEHLAVLTNGPIADWLTALGPALANHLWQSTAFAVAAWLLTLALRSNHARVRHAIWLAASIKFLVPFSLLIAAGNLLPHPQRVVTPVVYSAMDVVEEPFTNLALPSAPLVIHIPTLRERLTAALPASFAALWLLGAFAVLARWLGGWRLVRRSLRDAPTADSGREFELLRQLESQLAPTWVPHSSRGVGAMSGKRNAHSRHAVPLPLRLSSARMEPGVFGVLRPVLLWPQQLTPRLTDEHIQAILAHELMHVRRRDNLTAALHMLVETLFWFHPLVWWMERQMIREREQACDEAVVALGGDARTWSETYAESLLQTCRFCIESPLACVAGVTGADLKQRIVEIITGRALLRMSWPKKLLLFAAAICVVAAPVVLGQVRAGQRLVRAAMEAAPRPMRAMAHAMIAEEQTPSSGEIVEVQAGVRPEPFDPCAAPDGARFDVVAIHPSKTRSGDWDSDGTADGVTLSGSVKGLVQTAFGLRDFQVLNEPDWVAADTFDISAKFEVPERPGDKAMQQATVKRWKERYRTLLSERFHLRCHMSTKVLPVYDLVVAKGGTRMKLVNPDDDHESTNSEGGAYSTQVRASGVSSEHIRAMLARSVDRTILDKTGLKGRYNFTLDWSTQKQSERSARDGKPSSAELPIALEEQLGLKLVASKGPVDVLVIDHIEKPSVDGAEVAPTAGGSAQSAEYVPTMTFDVASVRESKPNPNGSITVGGEFEPANSSHLRLQNFGFAGLLALSYPVQYNQIEGLQREHNRNVFNVEARSSAAADEQLARLSKEQVHLEQQHMMQVLMAERFHLKVHWEMRDADTYDLVVSKPGRLHTTGEGPSEEMVKAFGDRPIPPVMQQGNSRTGFEYLGYGATTADIAQMLTTQFGRSVNDKTGLTGKYYFHLKTWQVRESDRKDDETNPRPPLESAIRDDLGLKLVPSHGPVRALVIDHVEMPTEN